MPVLKIKNNGAWEQVSGIPDHTHVIDDITDFPTSLPANGGNADTVDGKHASDFASAAEMTTVQNDINDINTVIDGIEIPTTLPNPNTLTFTGAVEGTYDGSSPITVEIPQALQPDYNQNDQTAGDYIKNRPFYKEKNVECLLEEQTLEFTTTDCSGFSPGLTLAIANIPDSFDPSVGDSLTVVFDGVEYELSEEANAAMAYAHVGYETPDLIDSVIPFTFYKRFDFGVTAIDFTPTGSWTLFTSEIASSNHTIAVKKVSENIVKIPNEYLPETTYVDYSKAQELTDEQKSQARTNIGVETLDVSGKMDKNNPTGTGSFSLNRKAGTVVGANSHAEGSGATASGWYSHAEGRDTTASNDCSHAEGDYTTASGKYSHAEGSITTASGNNSHAEGSMTSASGGYSHAEGQDTSASGERSHAEGQGTSASGTGSHTEGYHTKASSSYQHAQGKYNIEDSSNVYADIIGNGTSDSSKSNAATVDWSGNAWYAGDVYVGSTSGTNKDEGSKKLATEEYVDNSVIVPAPSSADNGKYLGCENGAATWMPVEASGGGDISLGLTAASVGQTIKVKAVDENGKPTEWEAAKEKTLKWITVHSSTLTEEATSFSVSADENGKSITDYNPLGIAVALYIPADSTQADNNGNLWVYPQSKIGDNAIRVIGVISGWKTISRDGVWMWQGGDILGISGSNFGAAPVYRVSDYVMDGVYLLVRGDGNHLPVGTKAVVTILCEM